MGGVETEKRSLAAKQLGLIDYQALFRNLKIFVPLVVFALYHVDEGHASRWCEFSVNTEYV